MKLQKYKTSRLQADFIQGHHRTSEGFYKPERRVSSHGLRSYIVCTSIIVLSNQPTTLLLYTYTYTYTTYYTTTIYTYIHIHSDCELQRPVFRYAPFDRALQFG